MSRQVGHPCARLVLPIQDLARTCGWCGPSTVQRASACSSPSTLGAVSRSSSTSAPPCLPSCSQTVAAPFQAGSVWGGLAPAFSACPRLRAQSHSRGPGTSEYGATELLSSKHRLVDELDEERKATTPRTRGCRGRRASCSPSTWCACSMPHSPTLSKAWSRLQADACWVQAGPLVDCAE